MSSSLIDDKPVTFGAFCHANTVTDKERFDLAHHLAAFRYKRTILSTLGADIKPIKAALMGAI